MAVLGEIVLHQGLGVVDEADGHDAVDAQMGADQQGLGIGVADAADAAGAALELGEVVFKLGAEGRVGDGMDLPLIAALVAPDHHAGVPGTQMAVVVRSEEHVQHHIAVGNRAEITAHQAKNSLDSVMGSMYLPSL